VIAVVIVACVLPFHLSNWLDLEEKKLVSVMPETMSVMPGTVSVMPGTVSVMPGTASVISEPVSVLLEQGYVSRKDSAEPEEVASVAAEAE
jgi:hypothetical protein